MAASHHQPSLLISQIMLSTLRQLPPLPLSQSLLSSGLLVLDFLLKLLEVFTMRVYGMEGDGHLLAYGKGGVTFLLQS